MVISTRLTIPVILVNDGVTSATIAIAIATDTRTSSIVSLSRSDYVAIIDLLLVVNL